MNKDSLRKRKIVVIQNDEVWNNYLLEAFEDTPSTPEIVTKPEAALPLIRQGNPDLVFARPGLVTNLLAAAIRGLRASSAHFRAFGLGAPPETGSIYLADLFDESFPDSPLPLYEFHKKLGQHLPLPDPIRILVVDDEPEVGEVFQDYFDHRTQPAFVVETAQDGAEGEKRILAHPPHVLILDIKMPVRDGRELFRDLTKNGKLPPTVVFFDAVSADEVLEIRKWGNPAFVEKGGHAASMPEMSALIKKLAYFA